MISDKELWLEFFKSAPIAYLLQYLRSFEKGGMVYTGTTADVASDYADQMLEKYKARWVNG